MIFKIWRDDKISAQTTGDNYENYIIAINIIILAQLFAGCMKSEIKEIDAKLKNTSISEEKLAKLRN